MSRRALISTVYSPFGGLTTMVRAVARFLEEEGWSVRLAYYMPWSRAPELSVRVPSWNGTSDWTLEPWEGGDLQAYKIGVRFPEFEWRRYRANAGWRRAVEDHDVHIVVSGNLHAARPIVEQGRACLAWVATRYWPDKRNRVRRYPPLRRLFDLAVNTPVGLVWERRLARRVRLVALSRHTAREFRDLVPGSPPTVMPMGVDTSLFSPEGPTGSTSARPRLGFVGRLEDPRKNVPLLAETLMCLKERGVDADLDLVGGEPDEEFWDVIRVGGLRSRVRVRDHVPRAELPAYYRTLDAFLLPSHQEGLGIVGLEAMACGCPVVSTRCGGPEEYVRDGHNGFLVDGDPERMAAVLTSLLRDRGLRTSMAREAARTVRRRFDRERTKEIFWREFDRTFGERRNGAA